MFSVYVLRFVRDGGHYNGSSNDLPRRLSEHRRGHTRSTRHKGPFEVVHVEEYPTEVEARSREKFLKTGRGREELKRILKRR